MSEEKIVYTSCEQNGCYGRCVLKVHVKDNKITAIETDDLIHPNDPREDLSEKEYKEGMVQARACVRGRGWRQIVNHPGRLLHPMKRVGERGSGKWEQISWEEALDTIGNKMKDSIEKYGPTSVCSAYVGVGGMPNSPLSSMALGYGFGAWGLASFSGHEIPQLLMTGHDVASGMFVENLFDGTETPGLLDAKAIVMWGWDPAITYFEYTYYLCLAKERGIPIIVIDPVYSVSAETYATQWIPIKPGTDAAALLAIAQVLYEEDIYDHEYVSRHVEPEGFELFHRYVMGERDGIAKTPEWAEKICGIPAETLRGLARFLANTKPTFFKLHWSVARKLYGETAARLGIVVAAMTGNFGGPATSSAIGFCFPYSLPVPDVDWHRAPPTYMPPIAMVQTGLADAIFLKDDLKKGKITEDEYRRRIGAPPDAPIVDPHVVCIGFLHPDIGASLNGQPNINKRMKALSTVDLTFTFSTNIDHHYNQLADILLPAAEPFFETATGFLPGVVQNYMSNYFFCCFKAVDPPGEARPVEWVWLELARRLGPGKAEAYNGRLANVPYEKWDEVYEEAFREAYEEWRELDETKELISDAPSWEEFKKHPVVRIPLREPFYPFKEQMEGKKPFSTPSGKIEFAPQPLRDPDFPRINFRGHGIGGAVPTQFPLVPEWKVPPDSFLADKAKEYPLYMLTPHSHFRQHSAQDNNPWFQDEFRHAAWISLPDAKQRGIKDGDLVHVYSDKGEAILPAYVTARVVPGTVVVRFGAWYTPSKTKTEKMPFGIDRRGASNILTHDDIYPWINGAFNCGNLVEVELFDK